MFETSYYNYFEIETKELLNLELTPDFYIKQRKNRDFIKHSFKIKKFLIGDIVEFVYFYKHISLTFSGICIAIKKKSFILPDLTLILRNIIIKTGIEVTLSYFYNRAYKLKFLDYKRKFYTFNKNKLYFIRHRLNRESKVY
jgi:ribosomal protein L19